MLLNCSISPDSDEQWQNPAQLMQLSFCVTLLLCGTCKIQQFLGENHTSLYVHFVESILALLPLLRSEKQESLTLPKHQSGCGSLFLRTEVHRKNCSNMKFQQLNMRGTKPTSKWQVERATVKK